MPNHNHVRDIGGMASCYVISLHQLEDRNDNPLTNLQDVLRIQIYTVQHSFLHRTKALVVELSSDKLTFLL